MFFFHSKMNQALSYLPSLRLSACLSASLSHCTPACLSMLEEETKQWSLSQLLLNADKVQSTLLLLLRFLEEEADNDDVAAAVDDHLSSLTLLRRSDD